MKVNKKIITVILIIFFIIWILFSVYLYNIWFRIEDLKNYLWDNIYLIIIIFLLLFSLRIFLFIPSTLIIIWLWILVDNFLLTLIISIIWIFIWLLQTYYIWYLLEEDLEWWNIIKKIEPHLLKIKENWFLYVFLWCLTPFFPTDLICYSSWFARYNLSKFLIAWMLWELPLIILYSYLGWKADLFIDNLNYIFIWIFIIFIFYYIFKKIKQ